LHKPFATTGCGDHPCFQMPVQKGTHTEGSSMICRELRGDAGSPDMWGWRKNN